MLLGFQKHKGGSNNLLTATSREQEAQTTLYDNKQPESHNKLKYIEDSKLWQVICLRNRASIRHLVLNYNKKVKTAAKIDVMAKWQSFLKVIVPLP